MKMLLFSREHSQKVSSSSTNYQWGLEIGVSAQIPGTPVGAQMTFPPASTSKSATDMKRFFETESGYGVTAYAQCELYRVVGVMFNV